MLLNELNQGSDVTVSCKQELLFLSKQKKTCVDLNGIKQDARIFRAAADVDWISARDCQCSVDEEVTKITWARKDDVFVTKKPDLLRKKITLLILFQ